MAGAIVAALGGSVHRPSPRRPAGATVTRPAGRMTLCDRWRDAIKVQLDVVDDGRGFDRGAVREDAVGLRSLEQRVDDFGGSALVESTPGHGTRVTVRAPLPPPAED